VNKRGGSFDCVPMRAFMAKINSTSEPESMPPVTMAPTAG
jgi:hypothetical protein